MRDYDEASEAASDEPAFSNGTDGYAWLEVWCGDCVHDREARNDTGPGCPLVLVSLMQKTPAEWTPVEDPQEYEESGPYVCTEYRSEDDGGDPGPEPEPPPVCDGQMDIVDAYLDTAIGELTRAPVTA